jgi:uncharacterized protein YidB (DUF937 family)
MAMLDSIISEVGSRFGLGDKAKQLVGYLLSYMTSSGVGGLAGFLGKLKNMGLGSVLGNAGATLSGNQLSELFGGQLGAIASKLGLPESAVSSAAGMAVPAMLTKLAPGGVAPATLPAEITNLTNQFSLAGVTGAAGAAAQSATNWLMWLLPILAVGVAAFFLLRSCKQTEPSSQASNPGLNAPEFQKVESDVKGLFTSATSALTDVKDAATAEAAVPKLTELATKAGAMNAVIDKLPATAKEMVNRMVGTETASLQVIVDKLKALGGPVWDKLKPAVEALLEKLSTMSK